MPGGEGVRVEREILRAWCQGLAKAQALEHHVSATHRQPADQDIDDLRRARRHCAVQ